MHTPAALADAVAEQATEAAATAAGLLFRDLAIDFPLNTSVVRSYADAGKPGRARLEPMSRTASLRIAGDRSAPFRPTIPRGGHRGPGDTAGPRMNLRRSAASPPPSA